ncbi:MAG: hypothetical protein NZ849_06525 [Meiothermus sp.]|uniref:hypothetical protein n=1 Tax=Meiothermus sp. TaxID=1955249 RepID=UPI0025F78063|nr:hypothetical protein [Meiothermus sp.]MCS7058846.1 hypothetical protein [Meiothermus sp.]MCS7194553.1 hypothetical protein [Meiothermus sp.]MCX7740345.1 hypothetical protein [Meiothermus sp.]MDW8091809.1 hypothetical protein [Meiothermus sp.]MDW8482079.1 hypothetical protein [Meiothermus sp.]
MQLVHLACAAAILLLSGCSQTTAVMAEFSQQTRHPIATATLDAGNTGLAAYYCRRALCAGDDAQNQSVGAFLAFDLGGLEQPQHLRATLRLYQGEARSVYAELGELLVERIQVGEFRSPEALEAPALTAQVNRADGEGYLELDVTPALRQALAEGKTQLQFRLRFSRPTNGNGRGDLAIFGAREEYRPALVLR